MAGGLTNRGATKQIEDVLRRAISLALRQRKYTVASVAALRAVATRGVSATQSLPEWTLALVTGTGVYRWSGFSTASDTGTTVIKPTDAGATGAGRWLLVANPGGTATPLRLRGVDVTAVTAPYLRNVVLYEGERSDVELEGRIFGQRPCVAIEFVGVDKHDMGMQPGALKQANYKFQLWIVDFNARGDLIPQRGSEVTAELTRSPGAYDIAADLEDLLDGALGEQLGEVAIGYSHTGSTVLIDNTLADRGRIILQLELSVWATTGKQDVDAVDFGDIRGQLQTAIVAPPGEDVDPDNVIVSGLGVTLGIGLTRSPASGSAKIAGATVAYTAAAHTFAAFRDTYRDLGTGGTLTFTEVPIGAAAPALGANRLRIGYTRTDATGAVEDVLLAPTLRNLGNTFPIAT